MLEVPGLSRQRRAPSRRLRLRLRNWVARVRLEALDLTMEATALGRMEEGSLKFRSRLLLCRAGERARMVECGLRVLGLVLNLFHPTLGQVPNQCPILDKVPSHPHPPNLVSLPQQL